MCSNSVRVHVWLCMRDDRVRVHVRVFVCSLLVQIRSLSCGLETMGRDRSASGRPAKRKKSRDRSASGRRPVKRTGPASSQKSAPAVGGVIIGSGGKKSAPAVGGAAARSSSRRAGPARGTAVGRAAARPDAEEVDSYTSYTYTSSTPFIEGLFRSRASNLEFDSNR